MSKKKVSRPGVRKSGSVQSKSRKSEETLPKHQSNQLLAELRTMIEMSRKRAATAVNSSMVMLYWHIGERIEREILGGKRADYGKQVVHAVCKHLTTEYGRGFAEKNVRRMMQFAEVFPCVEIVAALPRQLSWSHLIEVIPMKDDLQRNFYIEMCRVENWSTRTLRRKIRSMLYERTAISRKPEALARQELEDLRESDRMTPDLIFRDPYILDFMDLADTYSEKDLEQAIIVELQKFILELGSDFGFIARQKRMTIGTDDFYLDLLFFHRRLNRLVAVELKLGKFTAAYKGQMELYLRWLNRYERRAHEDAPVGLIFCCEKNNEQVELLQLGEGEIRVAEYMTELPSRKILRERLVVARRRADEIISRKEEPH